jgi:hypothetical protein
VRCQACGMEYAGSHDCSAAAPMRIPEEMMAPPEGFCPGYYLRMALGIARGDGAAIHRTANDPDALFYGAAFSAIAAAMIFLVTALHKMLTREGATPGTILWGVLLGVLFVCGSLGVIAIVQIGLAHALARWFLGATGTFFTVLRPALLGWFVNCLTAIPVVGPPAAAIAWTAVLMKILEEVDGIARPRAFLISAGINAFFLALIYLQSHH